MSMLNVPCWREDICVSYDGYSMLHSRIPYSNGNSGDVTNFVVIVAVNCLKMYGNLSVISGMPRFCSLSWMPIVHNLPKAICVIVQFILRPLVIAVLLFLKRW